MLGENQTSIDNELFQKYLDTKFGFLNEKISIVLDVIENQGGDVNKLKERMSALEWKFETIQRDQKNTDSEIKNLKDIYEKFKNEIKDDIETIKKLISKSKLTPRLITGLIVSLLSSPAITLLIQALLQAKGILK